MFDVQICGSNQRAAGLQTVSTRIDSRGRTVYDVERMLHNAVKKHGLLLRPLGKVAASNVSSSID